MEYRRTKGSAFWHCCNNCPNWPKTNFDINFNFPPANELDPECKKLITSGKCKF